MAVLLPDRLLGVVPALPRPWKRDAHGTPVPPALTVLAEPAVPPRMYPGAASDQGEGTWSLRLDPQLWPVKAGDRISDGTLVWVATATRHVAVPGHAAVDHVQVTATLDPPEVP